MRAAKHENEARRLEALRRYEIVDSSPEPAFDDIARLVAHICQTPIAIISFIESERQWFKSTVGTELSETPLEMSICSHAILHDDLFVIPDTQSDSRTCDNPLVEGDPHLRFYAGAPLFTPDGQPIGTLCVLDYMPRDLSESQKDALRCLSRQVMAQLELRRHAANQAHLLEEQQQVETKLRDANAAKDQFLAQLSHELRTPLTPVLMIARALQSEPDISAAVAEDLKVLLRNVELEASLIDDLLDLTRVANRKLHLSIQLSDIHELIRQVVQTCGSGDVKSDHAIVKLRLDAQLHCAEIDPARYQQVLWNLLKNAIKFSSVSSPILVETRNTPAGELIVSVTDHGVGIEPELLPGIFNAFEQGSDITKRFGGLGLGLAITKAIMEMHGGSIAAASDGPGHGATFTLVLPRALAASTSSTEQHPAPHRPVSSAPLRILLVEDHDSTARIMARLLRNLGHDVTTTDTVRSAIKIADDRRDAIDLVISDLGLPDGTGHELMQTLRDRYALRGIALSGYGMEEDVRKSSESGFFMHLTKPIDFDELRTAIGEFASAALVRMPSSA